MTPHSSPTSFRTRAEGSGLSFPGADSGLEQPDELFHFILVQVGDCPVAHASLGPMKEMVALMRRDRRESIRLAWRGPDHQIDDMKAALIDEGRHRPPGQVIEAPADQG